MKRTYLPLLLSGAISVAPFAISAETPSDDSLLDLSLQELISLDVPDVTSVSKRKQRLTDSPAAVYVISDEDIRRTGVTSIPEALRMVPGMQVARLNNNTWSISTRGFNYIFANKLLVLIDGRTVYSPLFSGVNWDVQDTMLEDIARIEVIRGPGAALWGANAVNGVINIITKHAADTQGGLLSTGFGSDERFFGAYRYGGQFGNDGYYRAYYKQFERNSMLNADGSDADDDWHMRRSGFKASWQPTGSSEWTVQGDIYEGSTQPSLKIFDANEAAEGEQLLTDKSRDQKGGNLMVHWKNNHHSVRAVYDNYQNFDYRITEKRDDFALDYQNSFVPAKDLFLIWGLGYRSTWYSVEGTDYMYLLDGSDRKVNELYSAFIQHDVTMANNTVFTFGSRFEHNNFTGFEYQPNMRLTWTPTENRTFWSAVSRAVKTPSLSETELQTVGVTFNLEPTDGINYIIPIAGNPELDSEKLLALEFGYRETFTDQFRVDSTLFINHYDDILAYVSAPNCLDGATNYGAGCTIRDLTPDTSNYPQRLVYPLSEGRLITQVPTILSNGIDATSYGLEVTADWQATPWWKLQLNYSFIQTDAHHHKEDSFLDRNEQIIEDLPAQHSANIRSSMNLPNHWQLDTWIRYMDNMTNAKVGAYTALDVKATRTFEDNLEFSIVGQNLFETQRKEFDEIFSGLGTTEVEASWYLQLRWKH
ncbi:TonB-dependent receptor plug domain-containing protein [Endozoicomonas ascidiicola]|uniref:TonB-dependent receptor plug domain-containing protein n=1 Tax=Endozoicomonas ascidiicola TaxID=1698521 RepID=UPI0008322A71|nr:TonB-dependent receptor [Endozoicomonas ascidiicola]